MKIRNYNPEIKFTLNDLKLLLLLEEDYPGGAGHIIDTIVTSLEQDTTFTFESGTNQIAYDILYGKAKECTDEYEIHLLENGYLKEDIDEYHNYMREKNNNE